MKRPLSNPEKSGGKNGGGRGKKKKDDYLSEKRQACVAWGKGGTLVRGGSNYHGESSRRVREGAQTSHKTTTTSEEGRGEDILLLKGNALKKGEKPHYR